MSEPLPGLYVHVPFCRKKCPYCDFYSITDLALVSHWLEALAKELSLYRADFSSFDSLYLGGGTPSLLDERQLAGLLAALQRQVCFTPDCEVTLEANPDDLTPEKLLLYRKLGINRLSLGVQSFHDEELHFLGRRHTARQAQEAVLRAREAGCANLSLDLMYGLPGQSLDRWQGTLATALSYNPEHLSCYQLTVEPETALGRLQAEGRLRLLPEETEREFFLFTSTFLENRGYLHYEISNFARGKEHLSRHNGKYWRRAPYLGLGPGSHSFDGVRRWWNHRSLKEYCQALSQGASPVAGKETLTADQVRLESLLLGFRTREGVAVSVIQGLPGGEDALRTMQNEGLVEVENGRAVPTRLGLVLADRLSLFLID
jgi:oxygen-independent coproporphyrinogen-3 oxidase